MPTPGRALQVAALSLVCVAILAANLPDRRAPQEDAGVFLYAGSLIQGGGLPYRDVWDHKPPGVYYASALGLALGGGSPLGVWALELVALVVAAAVGVAALARAFGGPVAFFASAAWLLTVPRLLLSDDGFTLFAELLALPLQFAALALVGASGGARRDSAIGLLGGAAFLLKPTLVGLWLAYGVVVLAHPLASVRQRATRLALLGAAGAAPALLAGAYLAACGVLPDAWDQAIAYNVANAGTATVAERADAALAGMRLTLTSLLGPVALVGWLGALLLLRRLGRDLVVARPLLALALLDLPLEVLLASGAGRPYHYYYLAWLPALAVLAAHVAGEVAGRLTGRRLAAAIGLALVLMATRPATLVARLAAATDDGLSREAADAVRERTAAGDVVLLWGSRADVHVLSGRRAPTRYVYQYAPFFTVGYQRPARIEELLRDLERARPALIIDVSRSSFVTPPLDPAGFRSWVSPEPRYRVPPEAQRIVEYVAARYERAGALPGSGWPVYRRR